MSFSSIFHSLASAFDKAKHDVTDQRDGVIFTKRTLAIIALVIGIFFFAAELKPWAWELTAVVVALILGESYLLGKIIDNNGDLRSARLALIAEGKLLSGVTTSGYSAPATVITTAGTVVMPPAAAPAGPVTITK